MPTQAPGSSTAPSVGQPPPEMRTYNVDFTHEVSARPDNYTITRTQEVPASPFPARVDVNLRVVARSAAALASPAYVATQRRRQIRSILVAVAALDKDSHRDDFGVCTYPIVERMRAMLIGVLADADREGNTREIIRRVRDSFLNGGWERYRDAETRRKTVEALGHLTMADEVTRRDVDAVSKELPWINDIPTELPPIDEETLD